MPHPSAVIDYKRIGGTPEALAKELLRLNNNETAYMEHHLWRELPLSSWSPAFKKIDDYVSSVDTNCELCRRAAVLRARLGNNR